MAPASISRASAWAGVVVTTSACTAIGPVAVGVTEVDTATLATAIGASNIHISNFKSSFETREDRPIIAGHATEHTRLSLRYDITVVVKSIPLKQTTITQLQEMLVMMEDWSKGTIHWRLAAKTTRGEITLITTRK